MLTKSKNLPMDSEYSLNQSLASFDLSLPNPQSSPLPWVACISPLYTFCLIHAVSPSIPLTSLFSPPSWLAYFLSIPFFSSLLFLSPYSHPRLLLELPIFPLPIFPLVLVVPPSLSPSPHLLLELPVFLLHVLPLVTAVPQVAELCLGHSQLVLQRDLGVLRWPCCLLPAT